jgi:hypothetical protein
MDEKRMIKQALLQAQEEEKKPIISQKDIDNEEKAFISEAKELKKFITKPKRRKR